MRKTLLSLALLVALPLQAKEAAAPVKIAIPNPNTPGVKIEAPVEPLPRPMQRLEGEAARQMMLAQEGAKELQPAIEKEVAQFNSFLGGDFAVVFMDTNNPQLRLFIANGILKVNPDIYNRMESGLASIYVENGKLNGQTRKVCYVMNNPARATHIWNAFVPAEDRTPTGIAWAAKYLVAHEVGHCLDRWQRSEYLNKGSITASVAETLGVPAIAFERTFGAGRAVDAREYQAQQVVLNRDGALLQYQERVADAFAVLWMMGNKAPNANLKPIWDTRNRVASNGAYHSHATTPALEKAYAFGMNFKSMPDLQSLWNMARQSQIAAGVDPSLGRNSTLVNAEAENREAAPDTKPGQISQKGVLPAVVRFDRLPRFGQ